MNKLRRDKLLSLYNDVRDNNVDCDLDEMIKLLNTESYWECKNIIECIIELLENKQKEGY